MFTQGKILSSLGWQDSTPLTVEAKHSKCPGKPWKLKLHKNRALLPSLWISGRTNSALQICLVLNKKSSNLPNGVLVLQGSKIPMMVFVLYLLTFPFNFWFSGFNKVDCRALMSSGIVWWHVLWTLLNPPPFTCLLIMRSLRT